MKAMQWKGHVTVELGRALAAMCGYYLTKVEDTKTSDGIHYCIVDGGCHQINYDGQIKGMYEPYVKVLPKEVSMKTLRTRIQRIRHGKSVDLYVH